LPDQQSAAIERLEQRVQALEDELAITRAFHRYSHAVDHGGDFSQVFTEDAVFDVTTAQGAPVHKESGLDEILQYMARRGPDPAAQAYEKHVALSSLITTDGDEAQAESYWVALKDEGEGPFIFLYGRYHDSLVKRDGTWLLRERRAECDSVPRRSG
jgi:hypothetical protein